MNRMKQLVQKLFRIYGVPGENARRFCLDETWEQTFYDDFEGTELLPYWQHEREGIRGAGYWVNDAVSVGGSLLTIRTEYREDGAKGPGWYIGAVSTGHLRESGAKNEPGFVGFSQTHGYFECKCKVPKAKGVWAAFWLMPCNNFVNDQLGTGEDGAEVDIFESPFAYQTFCPDVVSHAVHIDGYGENLKSVGSPMYKIKNLYEDFHTYGLEWTPEEYVFYVDGYETFRTKDKVGTSSQVPEYMVLSVEVAGESKDGILYPGKKWEDGKWKKFWCGNPDDNDKSKKYDFQVDYVKVYQKKG